MHKFLNGNSRHKMVQVEKVENFWEKGTKYLGFHQWLATRQVDIVLVLTKPLCLQRMHAIASRIVFLCYAQPTLIELVAVKIRVDMPNNIILVLFALVYLL